MRGTREPLQKSDRLDIQQAPEERQRRAFVTPVRHSSQDVVSGTGKRGPILRDELG